MSRNSDLYAAFLSVEDGPLSLFYVGTLGQTTNFGFKVLDQTANPVYDHDEVRHYRSADTRRSVYVVPLYLAPSKFSAWVKSLSNCVFLIEDERRVDQHMSYEGYRNFIRHCAWISELQPLLLDA